MSLAASILYQFAGSFAFLVLAALGLAIIFGMMGIINMAHGELIMLGAYSTIFARNVGAPLPLAIIVGAVAVGIFGVILERTVIRYLYRRPLDSIVATLGLSFILSQGMLIIFGPSIQGDTEPLGNFSIGTSSYSIYQILLAIISLALLAGLYWLFTATEYGLQARATMQNAEVARSLGVDVDRVYMITFGIGSALAGLTGGLYESMMTTVPTLGSAFIVQAFITVVVGGANIILGTFLSAGILGWISALLSLYFGTFVGLMGLLVATIVIIRLLPQGISGVIASRLSRGK